MPAFLKELPRDGLVRLPCGTEIDLGRSRWDGPLTPAEIAACRSAGIGLAYDPAQIGWVLERKLTREEYALMRRPPRPTHPSAVSAARISLRPWRADDLDDYLALLDDPAVWTFMTEPYPDPLGPETASALIELSNESNHHEVRAIIRDGHPVGQVRVLFDADETLGDAEISYWIGREHWGKGIASEVVGPYSDRSFRDHPQLGSIFARVHDDNVASAKVLRKSGYRHRGADPGKAGWQVYRRDRDGAAPLH